MNFQELSPLLRFESKYVLTIADYYKIKADIVGNCRLDGFTESAVGRKYFVRSLYFDTYDYSAYYSKITGEPERSKLRVRTYSNKPEVGGMVSVEFKNRLGRFIEKKSVKIHYSDYLKYMSIGGWAEGESQVLIDFESAIRANHLTPMALVDYYREAWISRAGDDVRVTFDFNVSYMKSNELYPNGIKVLRSNNRCIIMEIKSFRDDINWVSSLVSCHRLHSVPNSKYVNAVENTQPNIWYR